jgi:hypothetical protein
MLNRRYDAAAMLLWQRAVSPRAAHWQLAPVALAQ